MAMAFIAFFFQAEDGIRDGTVTGVQTCALPISDGQVPEHDLVAQEGEERMRRHTLEVVQLLECVVDRALARGMACGVEGHCRERVRERGQEPGGAAQSTLPRPPASAAAWMSGSLDAAARRSTALARGSCCHALASPASAARRSDDLGGSFSRPNRVRPAEATRSRGSSAARVRA